MLKIKILIISILSVFLFNGCTRHGEVTPFDIITVGVVGAVLLDAVSLDIRASHPRRYHRHHYRYHNRYYHH